jgi:hypothetical protein
MLSRKGQSTEGMEKVGNTYIPIFMPLPVMFWAWSLSTPCGKTWMIRTTTRNTVLTVITWVGCESDGIADPIPLARGVLLNLNILISSDCALKISTYWGGWNVWDGRTARTPGVFRSTVACYETAWARGDHLLLPTYLRILKNEISFDGCKSQWDHLREDSEMLLWTNHRRWIPY